MSFNNIDYGLRVLALRGSRVGKSDKPLIFDICGITLFTTHIHTRLPLVEPLILRFWDNIEFVYFLVANNNNKYLSHVFENIIFGISVLITLV